MLGKLAFAFVVLAIGLMSGLICDATHAEPLRAPDDDRIAGPAEGPCRRLSLDTMVVEEQHDLEKVFGTADGAGETPIDETIDEDVLFDAARVNVQNVSLTSIPTCNVSLNSAGLKEFPAIDRAEISFS